MENEKISASEETSTPKNPSRFSRRRFLQTGIATSPLLMTVKSPMAWGCGNHSKGSADTYVSGNSSTVASCRSKKCMSPRDWDKVIRKPRHDKDLAKQALNWCGINERTKFNKVFLSNCFRYQSCSNPNWQFKLMKKQCDSPTFSDVLQSVHQAPKLVMRVKKRGNKNKKLDIEIKINDFHQDVVCGYLNAVCAPDIIDSSHSPRDIVNAVNQGLFILANKVQRSKSNRTPDLTHLGNISRNLRRTWSHG